MIDDCKTIVLGEESQLKKSDSIFSKLKTYKRAKYIGRVFQDPMMGTAANMWIEENLALAARRGKRMSQDPFNGFHNARFEVSDDTVYYVYQQGMKLKTYYIRDAQIKKIIRDDEAGVLCIEGKATVNIQTRDSETEESLDKFYALVPFDKYELDDLLAPYKRKVVKADGKLRENFN